MLRLRFLFRYVPGAIVDGPNKGQRWSVATRSTFLRGRFERSRCEVIARLAEGRSSFWDLGAHYGYIALLASSRVRPGGAVYAVEPNQDNLSYLRRHVCLNRCTNVQVLPIALGHCPGEALFSPVTSGTGLVVADRQSGAYTVQVESVDSLVSSGRCRPPDMLKVDIDHTHVDFLAGSRNTLQQHPTTLLIATNNSRVVHRRFTRMLQSWDYTVHSPARCQETTTFRGIESELLAVGPGVALDRAVVESFLQS